jgi:hypothetical protein
MGLDSLMAIELKNAIQTNLGIALPVSVLVSGPSISELVEQVLELLNGQDQDGTASDGLDFGRDLTPNSLGAEEAEQLLASLDELSLEQVDSLLAEMLNDSR